MSQVLGFSFVRANLHPAFLLGLFLFVLLQSASAQNFELPRQTYWGASVLVSSKSGGGVVRRITPATPAEKAGLKVGDVILEVNGKQIVNQKTYDAIYKAIPSGETAVLRVSREGKPVEIRLTPIPLPKETIKGVDVIYDSVVTEKGHRVRTIITKPENTPGRLPSIFFVPWLSCDSIEAPVNLSHGWARTLRGLAEKSGFVLMRVERPGLGDSEGPDCSQNDLQTDVAAYRAGLQALKKYDFVDTNNLFLLGGSLGGALAPILEQGEDVRGLIVSGGFAKTWYEHMLWIERTRLEMSGKTPAETNQAMRGYSEFYSLYLNEKLTPAEVIRRKPALASLWTDEPESQYGRPAAFYHQVQDLNVEGAWEKISVPVLIVYGEYDFIMSGEDHELAARIVNRNHPGKAQYVVVPKMNHLMDIFGNREKAFKFEGGKFDEKVVTLMVDWLKNNQSDKSTKSNRS